MYWIYIFKCSDQNNSSKYYVGQTKRLFRRFNEHLTGDNTLNTVIYEPQNLVGLYKVSSLLKFFRYNSNILSPAQIMKKAELRCCSFDEIFSEYKSVTDIILNTFEEEELYPYKFVCDIENDITELMMYKYGFINVRGGKYVRFDCNYSKPKKIKSLPFCYCNLPCDIKYKDDYLYFRCSKKNIWKEASEFFDINFDIQPCKFFKKYLDDDFYKNYYNQLKIKNKKALSELFKKSTWLVNVPNYEDRLYGAYYGNCIGQGDPYQDLSEEEVEEKRCNNYKPNNMISYLGNKKVLCWNCFKKNNNELSKKYTIKPKCLIMSDSEDDN